MDEDSASAASDLTAARSSAVPLRVDHVTEPPAAPGVTLYGTDIEGTELRVAVPEPSTVDRPLETGQWYRFDSVVRATSRGAELLCPSGDGSVAPIDAPARRSDPPADRADPWLVQLGASEELVAVTVTLRPMDGVGSIGADDPETFEVGAVCFAPCNGAGDTTVYHREAPATRDEHLLLAHVVEDLSEADGTTLVTRGGSDHAPLALLSQRLALAGAGDVVATGAEQVLERCFHADADRVAVRAGADTLAEAARQLGIETDPVLLDDYEIGLHPADWREWAIEPTPLSDISDPRMTDRDYSALVERYLGADDESVDSAQLAQCLKAYASADCSLLCALATDGTAAQLGCPRLSGRLSDRDQSG